jgi:cell shape-determining protein MreC
VAKKAKILEEQQHEAIHTPTSTTTSSSNTFVSPNVEYEKLKARLEAESEKKAEIQHLQEDKSNSQNQLAIVQQEVHVKNDIVEKLQKKVTKLKDIKVKTKAALKEAKKSLHDMEIRIIKLEGENTHLKDKLGEVQKKE